MSPWQRERIEVGIGVHAVACMLREAARAEHRSQVLDTGLDPSGRAERLCTALQLLDLSRKAMRSTKRVMVADGLVRYWMMKAPDGVASLRELQVAAQARCHQIFGQTESWRVAGDWHGRRPFLCVAIPSWVGDGAMAAFGPRIQLRLALQAALQLAGRALSRDGWFCVTLPGCTTLVAAAGGGLGGLRSLRSDVALSSQSQLELAARELRREHLRGGPGHDAPIPWFRLPALGDVAHETFDVDGIRFVPALLTQEAGVGAAANDECADAVAAAQLGALT